ncbi:MAG TPA: class I SAM-dependent methyltransferase [Anaerolineae bacterium]|nr:class I SAM-dependent methyltransferase [Anaerolineae bacterium]
MATEKGISEDERLKRAYYDLVGDWNLPIVHMGGLSDTYRLLEMCEVDESSRVLEVGCGVGFTACEIGKQYGARVVGIDLSENMIANAKKRAQSLSLNDLVEFRVGDVTELPFDDGSFDVVIMESFLNILGEPGLIGRALQEISRVTKPGGRVGANEVFVDASAPSEVRNRLREHLEGVYGPGAGLARHTDEVLRKLFEDAGLSVIEMVKKPAAGTRSQLVRDLVKVMGLGGFMRYSLRAAKDMMLNSELREATKKAAPAVRLMERDKDTRDYFGYALIVAGKS